MSSSTGARFKSNANSEMTKANEASTSPVNTTTTTTTTTTTVTSNLPDTSAKNEKKKKVFLFYVIIHFSMHYVFIAFQYKGMVHFFFLDPFCCLDEVYPSEDFRIKAKWEELRRRSIQTRHGRR